MSNNRDNSEDTAREDGLPSAAPGAPQNPGRRRFSSTALAGSAVLLSLGNRTAWGQTVGCMSVATLDSFNPVTGMFQSAPGARPEHDEGLAAEIHYVTAPDDGDYFAEDVLGSDGSTVYSSCQDPDSLDGVCLIESSNCP